MIVPIVLILVAMVAIVIYGISESDIGGYYLYRLRVWLGGIVCRIRGHHNWEWRSYGGLGGSYCVKKCSCCDASDEDSFTAEETC